MAGILRVPRTRGVASGVLLILLGCWGALAPFVGPYFHFAYTPDTAWTLTAGRFWLEILPGAVTAIGGLILLISAFRPAAMVGAIMAAAAGTWFALGSVMAPLWTGYGPVGPYAIPAALYPGNPVGGPIHLVAERLAFFAIALAHAAVTVVAKSEMGNIELRNRNADEILAFTADHLAGRHKIPGSDYRPKVRY